VELWLVSGVFCGTRVVHGVFDGRGWEKRGGMGRKWENLGGTGGCRIGVMVIARLEAQRAVRARFWN
jgi:hypothetical protein